MPSTKSRPFQFLIFCVALAAMIFGLVHALIYFTDSTDAAARVAVKSAMAINDR